MNDPQNQESLRSDHAELEQFEQQLRSLTPRAARFQLSEEAPPTLAPTAILNTSADQHRGRKTYALTLLATWSLGAAAGVLITLGLQNPSVGEVTQAAVEQTESAEFPDASQAIFSAELGVNARGTQSEVALQSKQVTPPSSLAITMFAWQMPLQRSADASPLTAFSHVFPISDLDAAAMRLGNPSSGVSQAPTNSEHPRQQTPIVPVKISLPPPSSQRDMLHDLLDTYGSI